MDNLNHSSILPGPNLVIIGPLLQEQESASRQVEQLVDQCDSMLFVDGGHARRAHLSSYRPSLPCLSVGDNDSGLPEQQLDINHPPAKERSDLALALDHIDPGATHLSLLGFAGARLDHQIINFGVVDRFLRDRDHSCQATWYQRGEVQAKSCSAGIFHFNFSGTFSLITLAEQPINLSGHITYPLKQQVLPAMSDLGLSNVAHGHFTIEATKPFLLVRAHQESHG